MAKDVVKILNDARIFIQLAKGLLDQWTNF